MRRWTWELECPKCGQVGMSPKWDGVKLGRLGFEPKYVQYGFEAVCNECGYVEQVLPLDAEAAE